MRWPFFRQNPDDHMLKILGAEGSIALLTEHPAWPIHKEALVRRLFALIREIPEEDPQRMAVGVGRCKGLVAVLQGMEAAETPPRNAGRPLTKEDIKAREGARTSVTTT